jgi:hypothetical protein
VHRTATVHLQGNLGRPIWDGISEPGEQREPALGLVQMSDFVFWKAFLIFGVCRGTEHECASCIAPQQTPNKSKEFQYTKPGMCTLGQGLARVAPWGLSCHPKSVSPDSPGDAPSRCDA